MKKQKAYFKRITKTKRKSERHQNVRQRYKQIFTQSKAFQARILGVHLNKQTKKSH